MAISYVLVTGATGFIGAHVVDALLSRGLKVRGATRSPSKWRAMTRSRPKHASQMDFVHVRDFEKGASFVEAVKGVDAVVHVASPLTYDTKDNEKELILPAINGVKAIMEAAASNSAIQRVIITSSFAAVLNTGRTAPPYFTYTGADWNPLTYADSIDPSTSAVIAYRGSKKFAELAAWEFVERENPSFDIVALCPPMTFGPVVHHIGGIDNLNESNAALWKVASGEPLPVARVPFWIDVRDLAEAHVEALLRPEAGGKRYIPASPELFSYQLAADIMLEEFEWARGKVVKETEQKIDGSHGLDGETVAKELGVKYTSFRQTVVDLVSQAMEMSKEG